MKIGKSGLVLSTLLAASWVVGCGSGDEVVVQGEFPIVFAKRGVDAIGNPTDSVRFVAGGDLMYLDLASPSGEMINLTEEYTQGAGDVSDPEVSYDGTKVLFSMRGPNDSSWDIFEMDLATRELKRIVEDDSVAAEGNDVDPAYLPDGRIVFTSNRQTRSKELMAEQNTEPYTYLDEYEREGVTALHVMNGDGTEIKQISFNQSHDRNPTVLLSGEIMFARWDHVGGRNHFPLFFTNPDGTNIFVQYGAFSPGNSFLHPREMPNGKVMTSLMPLSGSFEGGALMEVDIVNFSDNDQPVTGAPEGAVGQKQLTLEEVDYEMGDEGLAEYGRYTTPYPLWDGTNRALVSWTPSRPTTETDPVSGEEVEVEGDPLYGVYMFSLDDQTLRPIAIPDEGWAYVDAIAVTARDVPNTIPDKPLQSKLAAEGMGVLNVKSVYDTDDLDIMGDSVLVEGEVIPKTAAPPDDTRNQVADLAKMKDPAQTTADERPGRFVRIVKAVPTPSGLSREAIGETDLEMQQIVGYSELQPDGSVRIEVPADTPLGLTVLDKNGLAFQTHTNWLQVRPGETRTCNGCHSPRRGSAINSTPIAGEHPNTKLAADQGESMAETLTRLYPDELILKSDLDYEDVWTDPAQAGREPDTAFKIDYSGLITAVPQQGIINFPDHVASIFAAERGEATCTGCHNNSSGTDPVSVGLDLRDTISGTGRVASYEALVVGEVVVDEEGLPVVEVNEDGELELVRADPLVETGGSGDSSRTTVLLEKLLERELRSGEPLAEATVDHSGMLNASELRVIAEWVDLGGQYYNDPFDVDSPDEYRSLDKIRGVSGLSEAVFEEDVHPILLNQCASCHEPFSSEGASVDTANPASSTNNFVLTGALEGDYNVTLTMVSNVCEPAENALLQRPTSDETSETTPHPRVDDPEVEDDPEDTAADDVPMLEVTDPAYRTILDWIVTGNCT